jgi:hypothetical protein
MDIEAKLLECHLLRGEAMEVLGAVEALLDSLDPGEGAAAHAPALHRVRGYSLLSLGRTGDARGAFDTSLALARERNFTYGVALALHATTAVDQIEHGTSRSEIEAERDVLLHGLGVVQAVAAVGRDEVATHIFTINGPSRTGRQSS